VPAADPHRGVARIGPNAITRVAEAMRAAAGEAATQALFEAAGLAQHLREPPAGMVAEADVTVLHAALRARLGEAQAAAIAAEAGRLTGDYLLAHRIPRPLQAVLRRLPSGIAARVLLGAIARHAWTFAGSGGFRAEPGHPARIVITGCPLCRGTVTAAPACTYFAATMERLCRALVSPQAIVRETACAAVTGGPACSFALRWRDADPAGATRRGDGRNSG
jgi:divinyl protochlorophyllide a 8-vinyl-reductase